jgi:hypothetical protein
MSYKLAKRLAEGVVVLDHPKYGRTMWVTGKTRRSRTRRAPNCEICKTELASGMLAWRPLTNGYNRMHRICVVCLPEKEG